MIENELLTAEVRPLLDPVSCLDPARLMLRVLNVAIPDALVVAVGCGEGSERTNVCVSEPEYVNVSALSSGRLVRTLTGTFTEVPREVSETVTFPLAFVLAVTSVAPYGAAVFGVNVPRLASAIMAGMNAYRLPLASAPLAVSETVELTAYGPAGLTEKEIGAGGAALALGTA